MEENEPLMAEIKNWLRSSNVSQTSKSCVDAPMRSLRLLLIDRVKRDGSLV